MDTSTPFGFLSASAASTTADGASSRVYYETMQSASAQTSTPVGTAGLAAHAGAGAGAGPSTPAEETDFLISLIQQQRALSQQQEVAASLGSARGAGSNGSVLISPTPRLKTGKVVPESLLAGVSGWSGTLRGSDYGRQQQQQSNPTTARRSSRPHNSLSSTAPLPTSASVSPASPLGVSQRNRRRSSEGVLTATAALLAAHGLGVQPVAVDGPTSVSEGAFSRAVSKEIQSEGKSSARDRQQKEDQVLREWALRNGLLSPSQIAEMTESTMISPVAIMQVQQQQQQAGPESGRSTMTITEESKMTILPQAKREDGECSGPVLIDESQAFALATAVAMAAIMSSRAGGPLAPPVGNDSASTSPQVVTSTKTLADGTMVVTARSVEEARGTVHSEADGQEKHLTTVETTEVVVELSPIELAAARQSLQGQAGVASVKPLQLQPAEVKLLTQDDKEEQPDSPHLAAKQTELPSLFSPLSSGIAPASQERQREMGKEEHPAPMPVRVAAVEAALTDGAPSSLSTSSLALVEVQPHTQAALAVAALDPLASLSSSVELVPVESLLPPLRYGLTFKTSRPRRGRFLLSF
jgi:hypothetical protein